MNIAENKLMLIQRRESLHNEIAEIQNEVKILQMLLHRSEEELKEIQIKLGEREESNTIKLAYAS